MEDLKQTPRMVRIPRWLYDELAREAKYDQRVSLAAYVVSVLEARKK
jgi:hypothetical protein